MKKLTILFMVMVTFICKLTDAETVNDTKERDTYVDVISTLENMAKEQEHTETIFSDDYCNVIINVTYKNGNVINIQGYIHGKNTNELTAKDVKCIEREVEKQFSDLDCGDWYYDWEYDVKPDLYDHGDIDYPISIVDLTRIG